jgi:hypothetical protein
MSERTNAELIQQRDELLAELKESTKILDSLRTVACAQAEIRALEDKLREVQS